MTALFITLGILFVLALGVFVYATRGPIGYEDKDEFHFGDEPNPFVAGPEGRTGVGSDQSDEISDAAFDAWRSSLDALAKEKGMRWVVSSFTRAELMVVYQDDSRDLFGALAYLFEIANTRRL